MPIAIALDGGGHLLELLLALPVMALPLAGASPARGSTHADRTHTGAWFGAPGWTCHPLPHPSCSGGLRFPDPCKMSGIPEIM